MRALKLKKESRNQWLSDPEKVGKERKQLQNMQKRSKQHNQIRKEKIHQEHVRRNRRIP